MDTFDVVNLGVFMLFLILVVARSTFWKRNGQLLRFLPAVPSLLLCAIGALTLSVNHHWTAPHRRTHELFLAVSAVVVSLGQLAVTMRQQWREAKQKKARRAMMYRP